MKIKKRDYISFVIITIICMALFTTPSVSVKAAGMGMSEAEIKSRLSPYSSWFIDDTSGAFTLQCPKKDVSFEQLYKYVQDIHSLLEGELGEDSVYVRIIFPCTETWAARYKEEELNDVYLDSLNYALPFRSAVCKSNISMKGHYKAYIDKNGVQEENTYMINVALFLNGVGTDSDYKAYYKKLNSIVQNAVSECNTEVELVKYFDKWIAKNITYGKNHTALYTLLEGKGVCEGMASLFYDMCHTAGIPVMVLGSEYINHAWNAVYVDNEWYVYDTLGVVKPKGEQYRNKDFSELFTKASKEPDYPSNYNYIKKQLINPSVFVNTGGTLKINGKKYNLKQHVRNTDEDTGITYKAQNNNILKVSKNGKITAKKKGKTSITLIIKKNGKKTTIKQKVQVQ